MGRVAEVRAMEEVRMRLFSVTRKVSEAKENSRKEPQNSRERERNDIPTGWYREFVVR